MTGGNITNSSDTVPLSSSLTGTVSCAADSKLVTGSSTAFKSELRRGDYLYDNTNGEIRRVDIIKSDTELYLFDGFTNLLSGATIKRVVVNSRQYSITAEDGNVTITYEDDTTLQLSQDNSNTPQAQENGIVKPVLVTAGSGVNARLQVVN